MSLNVQQQAQIKRVTLADLGSCPHIAEILLEPAEVQKPTWVGLHRYWRYARPEIIEEGSVSFHGHLALFTFTVASGQGGIVAVWNCKRRRWEHVSNSSFVRCGLLLSEANAILSLCYDSYWGVKASYRLSAHRLDRTREGFLDISVPLPLRVEAERVGLDPGQILCRSKATAYPGEVEEPSILLLEGKKNIFVWAEGTTHSTTVENVRTALQTQL